MDKTHKKLRVWQEAMPLAQNIIEITKVFPAEEKYGIVNQMRRAAVSVPSNISEGAARNGIKDSIHFYIIARGSLSELDTQVELCKNLGLLKPDKTLSIMESIETVDALLNGLIRFNKNKTPK
jgi:four helix bundle protein